jgi:hypothetical protein
MKQSNQHNNHHHGRRNTDGEVCYFCLEEADKEGKPPVRDCACRGDSAGFAHLSCLVNYAERKSKAAILSEFHIPWKFCNNCKWVAIERKSTFRNRPYR